MDVHLVAVPANRVVAVDVAVAVYEVVHVTIIPLAGFDDILKLDLSVAYFNDLLKFETGKTLEEYLQLKRLDIARHMLLQDGHTPAAVARKLGYPNVQCFSVLFKKITGVAPSGYRLSQN